MPISGRHHYDTFGFVVVRGAFDPGPLAGEVDRALDGASGAGRAVLGSGEIRFGYAPMMTEATPASLRLLDVLEALAVELEGGPVLPTRAKGVRYVGDSPWHADSEDPDVASVGLAAYLEPLREESGALRVLPGSHHRGLGDALRRAGVVGLAAGELPAHVVATEPGDVIAFDEHLFHASAGGGVRRQWRLDYVRDAADAEGEARLRDYFARIFVTGASFAHDAYDADVHPSYGASWRASGRRAARRLAELGVYALADRAERRA